MGDIVGFAEDGSNVVGSNVGNPVGLDEGDIVGLIVGEKVCPGINGERVGETELPEQVTLSWNCPYVPSAASILNIS